MKKRCVVLLSGGLDSTTTLFWAKAMGYELFTLSFDYGQRHKIELEKAEKTAAMACVTEHIIVPVGLSIIGGSALTDNIEVPKNKVAESGPEDIPVTYVPARNTIFLAIGLAYAEKIRAFDIFIGVNALDYSGYPDCRPEFISAFEKMADLATKAGTEKTGKFNIKAPLIGMTKRDIIRKGVELGIDFSLTHSCYDPDMGHACGKCDSCVLRQKGFEEAGVKDPLAD